MKHLFLILACVSVNKNLLDLKKIANTIQPKQVIIVLTNK